MLDHGADPARVNSLEGTNALHVMFGKREHDYVGEAKLLQRFLDGGADINLKAPKWDLPIYAIIETTASATRNSAPSTMSSSPTPESAGTSSSEKPSENP